mmetsp:Transcript_13001/g.30686  ORF Transcript_13001/g.30686 Transcript_13001/m.30686 type:complete len:220 (-) Transcript_13001:326-985(-)
MAIEINSHQAARVRGNAGVSMEHRYTSSLCHVEPAQMRLEIWKHQKHPLNPKGSRALTTGVGLPSPIARRFVSISLPTDASSSFVPWRVAGRPSSSPRDLNATLSSTQENGPSHALWKGVARHFRSTSTFDLISARCMATPTLPRGRPLQAAKRAQTRRIVPHPRPGPRKATRRKNHPKKGPHPRPARPGPRPSRPHPHPHPQPAVRMWQCRTQTTRMR